MSEPPVRLCCGQRHYGAVCPDDHIMNIGPGERLAVYVDSDVDQDMAKRLVAHVAKWADIAPERVAVFAKGMELKILTSEEA